jgi:heptosyltransferase-1
VQTFPVLEYLRRKFPHASIDWVIESHFAELVQSHQNVNLVLTVNTKAWRKQFFNRETIQSMREFRNKLRHKSYDVIFDLQGNIKSGLILSQARSQRKVGFGKKSVPEWPNLLFTNTHFETSKEGNIRQNYLSVVTSFFKDNIPQETPKTLLRITPEEQSEIKTYHQTNPPLVMVCPGAAWKNKQLTTESLATFLALLKDYLHCRFLFTWGSNEEKVLSESLHTQFSNSLLIDKMNLPKLQNLMAICDLVIAMDSLPLHLAGTTNTKTFSVFGPSLASKYKPLGDQHHAFQGSCPYGRTFVKRCPVLRSCPTGACIRDLKGQEIFENFKSWW